jgi:hypothetical protein
MPIGGAVMRGPLLQLALVGWAIGSMPVERAFAEPASLPISRITSAGGKI